MFKYFYLLFSFSLSFGLSMLIIEILRLYFNFINYFYVVLIASLVAQKFFMKEWREFSEMYMDDRQEKIKIKAIEEELDLKFRKKKQESKNNERPIN